MTSHKFTFNESQQNDIHKKITLFKNLFDFNDKTQVFEIEVKSGKLWNEEIGTYDPKYKTIEIIKNKVNVVEGGIYYAFDILNYLTLEFCIFDKN